jgi:hypothetical protein
LEDFARDYAPQGIRNLAMPKIAAGLGGLDWNVIRDLIEGLLGPLPVAVYVYEEFVRGLKGQEPPL